MVNIIISKNDDKQRLDRFLKKYFNRASNDFIQKIIRKKYIKVNGKREKGDFYLTEGDQLEIYLSDETADKMRTDKSFYENDILLDILYEDEHILLINKPTDMDVHPSERQEPSLLDGLLKNISYQHSDVFRPAICTRLDRNTTGIVIAAKSYEALKQINNALRNREIKKYYVSIAVGAINQDIIVENFLTKDQSINKVNITSEAILNSKRAKTIIHPLRSNQHYTEIEVELITGRTHQIRAHLQHVGHPLLGDKKYGGYHPGLSEALLHAKKLIIGGMTSELSYLNGKIFEAPLPEKYNMLKQKYLINAQEIRRENER
ncbi:MAG: RluA family pseudouridine synthase [Tissierellales bacterium]|nr:RluA family pseudouridine synthase [Tissierellales bacterium]MBN2828148.1 RluA family pseudouridine synthase [Tissierellales bacterium]